MSLWQTKEWSKMLESTGQVENIISIGDIFIQKRSIGLGQFGLFVMGINPKIEVDSQKLIEVCKKEKCAFIQIEYIDYNGIDSDIQINDFSTGYYKKFLTPYTAVINLDIDEEEILAKMKPKGRYNIKLARKKGIIVEKVEKTDQNIKKYYELSTETTSRDNFSGHGFEYYKKFLHILENSELILASVDREVIAGGIFVFDSDISYYYYGASTSNKEYRNLMAPYLLQWHAIQHAKKIGSKIYDFLGISGEGKDFDSSLSGVTDFKMKLTPNSIKISNSYIFINKKVSYIFIILIKQIKSHLK